MHVDPALQAMLDQSLQQGAATASQTICISASATSSKTSELKGSYASTFPSAPLILIQQKTSADKRLRESPDSTLTPEGN